MKFYVAFLSFTLYYVCLVGEGLACDVRNNKYGSMSESLGSTTAKCWTIEVPENMYTRIKITRLDLAYNNRGCSDIYMKVTDTKTKDSYTYCHDDKSYGKTITALNDVTISFSHYSTWGGSSSYFGLEYHIEDLMCVQKSHFRCSNHTCIHKSKVCDRVKDCENGSDEVKCEKGVLAEKGVNESLANTISWLLKKRQSFDWGRNTHRAITALYLSEAAAFNGSSLEEELMAKELELKTSVALMRNTTETLSVGELSMFINALSATCHNARQFYGLDLVKVLSERVSIQTSASPGAYLTLCNSNWTLSESDIDSLEKLLYKPSSYPFALDVQAVTVMALTCVKNLQGEKFERDNNASDTERDYNTSDIYNATVEKFINSQLPDGSFGNVYTTALVTQALIASGQEDNSKWNLTSTIRYLMVQLNSSSVDFLSAYLALPIFNGRSLIDLATINCANISRRQNEDNEISDVTEKLGGKMNVQYSLYIGDQKDIIHTIFLRLPGETSAYDVMRVAQVADPKYKNRQFPVKPEKCDRTLTLDL